MLSGGNSCAEHEGQGRGSAQGQVSGTPESRDSKLLESLIHPKEAALGKDMEEAQGITVSKVRVHWGGRVGLVLGCVGTGEHWDRGALLLIQTQTQHKTLGKTSKGK